MKYFVVFACLLVAAYGLSPELKEKLKTKVHKLSGECKSEMGATDEDVAPMMANEPPKTEKGKCFVACMNKKMGFQDASGKIDKDGTYGALEKLKPLDEAAYEKAKKVADTCLEEVKDADNECETAANMYNCVKKQEKELGIEQIDW